MAHNDDEMNVYQDVVSITIIVSYGIVLNLYAADFILHTYLNEKEIDVCTKY